MKNITITMDEEPAEWVRIEAAKRNTSVSRMLGDMVAVQMRQQDAYQMAMRDALQFKTWGRSEPATVKQAGQPSTNFAASSATANPTQASYADRDALYDRPRFR